MTFNEWSMVGNNEKRISLFENVRSKITAQTKCTIGIDCISFQGGIAPIQHPDGSLLINLVVHSLIPGETVGADLSCTSPIYRPWFSSTNFPNAPLSGAFAKFMPLLKAQHYPVFAKNGDGVVCPRQRDAYAHSSRPLLLRRPLAPPARFGNGVP